MASGVVAIGLNPPNDGDQGCSPTATCTCGCRQTLSLNPPNDGDQGCSWMVGFWPSPSVLTLVSIPLTTGTRAAARKGMNVERLTREQAVSIPLTTGTRAAAFAASYGIWSEARSKSQSP